MKKPSLSYRASPATQDNMVSTDTDEQAPPQPSQT